MPIKPAAVFPIPPEGNIDPVLSRSFLTNIIVTDRGREQRPSLRDVPVRTLEFTILAANASELGQFRALWMATDDTERLRFIVPIWNRQTNAIAFPDTSTISGNFRKRDFVTGPGKAIAWLDEENWELLDVDTVADDQLSLSSPITRVGGFPPKITAVMPVMTAWLMPPSPEQLNGDAERVALTFREELPGIAGLDPDVGGPVTPVAYRIAAENVTTTSPWGGSNLVKAVRVTVFDANDNPIPNAPLSWVVTPNYPDNPGTWKFPADGSVFSAMWSGNSFSGFGLSVTSGAVTLNFGMGPG